LRLAGPTTSDANTSGTTTMLMSRMKAVPTGLIQTPTNPENPNRFALSPNAAPAARAMRIFV